MKKVYNDTPDNFAEIQTFVITDVEEIAKTIIQADKCFFYDACAFRNHMRIMNPECIFEYIKRMGGIVVQLFSHCNGNSETPTSLTELETNA